MTSRYIRVNERSEFYTSNIEVFTERLKKLRALNGDPSRVGMDGYLLKRMPFNKISILTKSS
jgi:hypothetical protein